MFTCWYTTPREDISHGFTLEVNEDSFDFRLCYHEYCGKKNQFRLATVFVSSTDGVNVGKSRGCTLGVNKVIIEKF